MRRLVVAILLTLVSQPALAERKVSEEARVFEAVSSGVFTVFGDRGQGSGFLVDGQGLILTNSHVVSGSRHVSVQLGDSLRVAAAILADEKAKDIAVLRVAASAIHALPVLRLAPRQGLELAFVGERVVAIGSPLNQVRILTSGIVSKVEEHAIISDVNINHGNSGGPLLNMDAEVVAINTFGDFTAAGGPGVSGSISIDLAAPVLEQARGKLPQMAAPSDQHLPVPPETPYPLSQLGWVGKRSYTELNYFISVPGFDIAVRTPSRKFFLGTLDVAGLAKKRQERQKAAGVDEAEMYDPVGDAHKQWMQYLGDYAPVVEFAVMPKIGQTAGSAFGNFLGAVAAGAAGSAYYGSYNYEFKSDLDEFWIEDNGEYVPELLRGLGIMPVSVAAADAWGAHHMEDIAQQGVFVFLPNTFLHAFGRGGVVVEAETHSSYEDEVWTRGGTGRGSSSGGRVSGLVIHIKDLKKPGEEIQVPIPWRVLEQIWLDFEGVRDAEWLGTVRMQGQDAPDAMGGIE